MNRIGLLLLAACLMSTARVYATDDPRVSVVKIHVTQRLPDFARPWTKATPRKHAGSGVVIDGKRILTNAHIVQYASQVLIQADQSTEKIPASVVAMAPGVDLALIEPEEKGFLEGRPALALADHIPSVKQTVNVYGYPVGGEQLSVTEGIISRIEFTRFYYLTSGLRIQVDAALNAGNSGGPAIADGGIVGIVFSTLKQAQNIGYLVAAEEIRMFLDDVANGKYDGKPMMFDRLQSTENEALREKLGLKKGAGGLMVTRPYRETDAYPLKAWDVVTHIGEHELDNQGNVRVKDDLKLSFARLIPKVLDHGTVPLTVLREGKEMRVDLPVSPTRDMLIPFLDGKYPRYFICGPLTFTAATQELIARLGLAGQSYLATSESPLLKRQFDQPEVAGEELVVLGARLFPHSLSQGYGNLSFAVVTHVNDVALRNLAHLVETLRDATGQHVTFKFGGNHETLVFRRKELLDSTEEILEGEGIRNQYSEDLGALWRPKALDP